MKRLLACLLAAAALGALGIGAAIPNARAQDGKQDNNAQLPKAEGKKAGSAEGMMKGKPADAEEQLPDPRSAGVTVTERNGKVLNPVVTPIDLASALRLAGVQNPAILLARERVVSAVVERQLAAAVFLPALNAGLNYDSHTGPLQQSSGNILKVNRSALYVGAGANAVAAGTVSIPGVLFNYNISDAIYGMLASRQLVAARRFAARAAQNEGLRRVAVAYIDLLNAAGRRAVVYETLLQSRKVKELTQGRADSGLGRQGDADRAANEYEMRVIELLDAEQQVQAASAALGELTNLDPSTRLQPVEERLVPMPVVPDPIPLSQLVAIALLQRPETAQYQALLRQSMLQLSGAKLLPFSPNLLVGFSAGTFGGGSGLVAGSGTPRYNAPLDQPRFGNFGPRNDFDVIAYWTLQNLGVGNVALVRIARSKLSITDLERLDMLNRIRAEVANAYIRTHVRFAQISATEVGIQAGMNAYREDYKRIENNVQKALPLELLDSVRLLYQARFEYMNAIADYNRAQLELYVAMGQPPADSLARPAARTTVELGISAVPPHGLPPDAPGAQAPEAPAPNPPAANQQ